MTKKIFLTVLFLVLFVLCTACRQSLDEWSVESPQESTIQSGLIFADSEIVSVEDTESTVSESKLTDDFRALIEAEIERSAIIKSANKNAWFRGSNGERLQLVEGKTVAKSVAAATGTVFYYPEAGEKLEDIVVIMVEKLLEPFFTPSGDRAYTVTECFLDIEHQEIWDKDDLTELIVEDVWNLWLTYRSYGYRPEQFIPLAVEWTANDGRYGLVEEMWLLPRLKVYYKYVGKDIGLTFEEYWDSEQEKNGMMPVQAQGTMDQYIFLLVKADGMYRLSLASELGYEPSIYTDPFEKQ